ncbi:MAG TPA: hypothetical protein VFB45_13360 [Pseudolabrys sp.]|nr:hypothetical protein [Pseudolabrys sp.]
MSQSVKLLDHARRCFDLASKSRNPTNVGIFAELGREYLRLAHEDAAISEAGPQLTRRVG